MNDKPISKWTVYIVRCSDSTLYTGITNGLKKRLKAHNTGTGAKYTKSRRPVELIYAETAPDRSAASKREYVIKRLSRAEKLVLISGENNNPLTPL